MNQITHYVKIKNRNRYKQQKNTRIVNAVFQTSNQDLMQQLLHNDIGNGAKKERLTSGFYN